MKKRLTRLLAICVCLIAVLSACAGEPSGESTVSVTTEESKETSALELSEANAESTSSETEPSDESSESEPSAPEDHISADSDATLSGDITITPIEPTYPEERETTLEFVKEYPLGEGGIPFYLQYDSEPANAAIITPYSFLVDENGNVYSFDGAFFYDLQNHTELELPISERTVGSVLVYDGKLYCMNVGGVLNIYTMQEGKIDTVKFPTIKEGKEYGMFFSPDGVPLATADGKFYNIDGKQISDVYYLSEEDDHSNKLLHFGREYTFENDLYISSYTNGILTVFEKQEYRIQQKLEEPPYWHVENFREDIIYQYDTKGDPLSEFLFYLHYTGQKIPCSIFYKGEECKSYFTKTAIIGKQRFDNLIDANWFVGADGTIYLMLIDPEGGKLYKINPGYSDVEFTEIPIEPTYPEERETTLELVKEYPLGEGGIPFDIWEGENPAYKNVDLPGWFFADEQGNLYAFTGTTIYDLQNGKKLELSHDGLSIFQLIAVEDMLYGLETDGRLNIYTMQDGKVGSVKYPERSKGGMIDLFVSPDGKPRVVVDGVFYDETGKKITGDCVIENAKQGEDTLTLFGRTYSYTEDLYVQSYADGVLTAYESISHRNNISLPDQSTGIETFYEYIVYQYDKNGDPLSEFMIYRYYDPQSIPCSISRDGLECTSYEPITISVGDRVFENLLSSKWFVGADGTIYLLVIDPDGGELYKINPGYSDVEFTEIPIEPTYPEERETTLELVKEYPLGEGGIPFDIWEGENPAYKKVDLPGWFFADEQGNLYAFTGTTIYDLQNGKKLELSHDGLSISQMIALNGKIYGWESDGRLNIYTMQDGKVGSVKYPERSKGGVRSLFVSPDGKPRVVVDGVFYDETGKKITGDCVIENAKQGEDTLTLFGRTYSYTQDLYVQSYADGVLTAYESISHRNKISLPDQSTGIENFYEDIVYQYDKNGDPLSEFIIYQYSDPRDIPCSISRDGLECTSYEPITISVGDRVFENLLSSKWFVGADGTIYLLVIDPEGGELYKINPGYSDVEFTEIPIEPTYPEERETTLELVREYPLGGEGGIPFYLLYENDPEYAQIVTPDSFLMDKNGELYAYVSGYVYDIQTSERIRIDKRNNPIISLYMYNGKIYSTAIDGTLNTHSFEKGLESSVKIADEWSDEVFYVHPSADGTPLVYDKMNFYNADGNRESGNYHFDTDGGLTVGRIKHSINNDRMCVLSDLNGVLTVQELRFASYPSDTAVREYIYYQIGTDGNLISEFSIYQMKTPENLPCHISAEDVVCKWYRGMDVLIGKQLFEDVLSARYFMGADNQFYAMIIYPDRAELYRINPGYSDVTPIDFDKMGDPADFPETWGEVFGANAFSVSERTVA